MKNPKKILVPVDFSDCAREAVRSALSLAEVYGASLEILHVHEPPYYVGHVTVQVPGSGQLAMADYLHTQAEKMLEAMLAEIEGLEKIPVERTLISGLPDQVIVEHARAKAHDLIVMGTHGRRGVSRFLMGSVAERVLRRAPAPVLVVRDHYNEE